MSSDQPAAPHRLLTLTGHALTAAMNGIGMLFDGASDWFADFEETLFAASVEGLDRWDFRVLGVLTT